MNEKIVTLVPKSSNTDRENTDETLKFIVRASEEAEKQGAVCAAFVLVNHDGSVTSAYGGGNLKAFTLIGGLQYVQAKLVKETIES